MDRRIWREVRVYWDPRSDDWSYTAIDQGIRAFTGTLGEVKHGDLDIAVEEAIYQLGLEIPPSKFACEPSIDGGFAIWRQ